MLPIFRVNAAASAAGRNTAEAVFPPIFQSVYRKCSSVTESLLIPDSWTKWAIRSVIVLHWVKVKLKPYQKIITYILQFVILNIHQTSSFTLNMEKSHSKLVWEIKSAASPALMINVKSCSYAAIHLPSIKGHIQSSSHLVKIWLPFKLRGSEST